MCSLRSLTYKYPHSVLTAKLIWTFSLYQKETSIPFRSYNFISCNISIVCDFCKQKKWKILYAWINETKNSDSSFWFIHVHSLIFSKILFFILGEKTKTKFFGAQNLYYHTSCLCLIHFIFILGFAFPLLLMLCYCLIDQYSNIYTFTMKKYLKQSHMYVSNDYCFEHFEIKYQAPFDWCALKHR